MAPLNPTLQAEYVVSYTGPYGAHRVKFFAGNIAQVGSEFDYIRDVITAMAALTWDNTTFNNCTFRPAGSTVSQTLNWVPIDSPSSLTPDPDASTKSTFIQWGGRSTDGRRVKWYLFNSRAVPRSDMKYLDGEVGEVDAVTAALEEAALNGVTTISGAAPIIYTYANIGQNDYWTHQVRRS